MPELPEVETVKRGLKRLIVGKTITSVTNDNQKSFPNHQASVKKFVVGASILSVARRGKVLIIGLSTGYSLMIHLKMTGQLVFVAETTKKAPNIKHEIRNRGASLGFDASDLKVSESDEVRFGAGHPNDSLISNLPDKSTRVTFTFSDNSKLYFNDQRKFGWVKLIPTDLISVDPFISKLGPEPLKAGFTSTIFEKQVLKRPGTSIKAALLDQTVLAGVGNIYADESLWGAKVHPAKLVKNVSIDQLNALHREVVSILNLAIDKGGSTNKNYVNAEGKKGSYMDFARVFRRENMPCLRCRTIIIKTRVAGRGTHSCPVCQVL